MRGEPRVLGVDGGGSSTVAWIADARGAVIGRGRDGPSNIKSVGPKAAMNSLEMAILAAFADAGLEPGPIASACLGMAGFDRPEDKQWLRDLASASAWARETIFVNDGDLVVAAGTPQGWGVGLIAGTGSIAVGRAPDGRTARAGGWGHVFGDEGSGYAAACAGLRLVARRADGREPPTPHDHVLAGRIARTLGISGVDALVTTIYKGDFDRARIAALAQDVVEASRDDPAIAETILRPAGVELAAAVSAVARALGWESGPLPLAMAGGFLLATPEVHRAMLGRLAGLGYTPEVTPVPEPVLGALILAARGLEAP